MDANLVFGSSLNALQFAFQNKIKIILNRSEPPYIYEKSEIREAWNLLYIKLMIDGQTVGGDSVISTKVTDENIFVVSKGNVVNEIKYNKLFLFSDEDIIGLPHPQKKNINHNVVDLLIPISLSIPHLNHLKTNENFVSDIFFLKKGTRTRTELYVISNLTEEQLHDFDYSDTMVRFKCEDLLKKYGFEGARNGKNKLLIKLEPIHREVRKHMDHYKDTSRMQFVYGN